jgi:hypothetical protein
LRKTTIILCLVGLISLAALPANALDEEGLVCSVEWSTCEEDGAIACNDQFNSCVTRPISSYCMTQTQISPAACHARQCNYEWRQCKNNWESYCDALYCYYQQGSPIVIREQGAWRFTSLEQGVLFDIYGSGSPIPVSWVANGNGFLALDRDGDGQISSGKELFGNNTRQTTFPGEPRNGFAALRDLDWMPDGFVDFNDPPFALLLVWNDWNRNGVSEAGELRPAREVLSRIPVAYVTSRRADRHGNRLQWRGHAFSVTGLRLELADVIFVTPGNSEP